MDVYEPVTWYANYARGSGGYGAHCMYYSDSSAGMLGEGYDFIYDPSMKYHNIITYDNIAGSLSWEARCISNGALLTNPPQTKTVIGSFSGIDRLYSSHIGDDYAPGAKGEGYIDNVVLYVVPEPATVLLFGLGGLMLRRRRRA